MATSSLLSGTFRRKLLHTFIGHDFTPEALYVDNFYSAFSAQEQAALFRRPPLSGPYENFLRHWSAADGRSPLEQMLYADQKTYLIELLMKQDQMSMAASLESRVPLLDHTFVEFAGAVPARLKLGGGAGKYILKKAVEGLLPDDTIYRKKMGFPTPVRKWLASPRAATLLSILTDREGLLASYLDSAALDALLRRHNSGALDATDRIWRLLNLQVWGDIFITGRRQFRLDGLMREARA